MVRILIGIFCLFLTSSILNAEMNCPQRAKQLAREGEGKAVMIQLPGAQRPSRIFLGQLERAVDGDDPERVLANLPKVHDPRTAFTNYGRTGFTLIELLVVMAIVTLLMGLLMPAVQRVRESGMRTMCANNVKQLDLGIQQYEIEKGVYPQAYYMKTPVFQSSSWPQQPWTTLILPYIEKGAEARSSGVQLNAIMIKNFHCPSDPRMEVKGSYPGLVAGTMTSYNAVDGSAAGSANGGIALPTDGVIYGSSRTRAADIIDGSSNTVLIGERPPDKSTGWGWMAWGQYDSSLSAKTYYFPNTYYGCPSPGVFGPSDLNDRCNGTHFWSLHQGGAYFGFADGSVRFIRYKVDPEFLPNLATRAGGENVLVED